MPYLPKRYLSDKLFPTGVYRDTWYLQAIPYREQLMVMYNLQLLQTAFCPCPSTTKIPIASPRKNRFPRTIHWTLNLVVRPKLQNEAGEYGQNKDREAAGTPKPYHHRSGGAYQGEVEAISRQIAEGKKLDLLWAPKHYFWFHIGFTTFKWFWNGEMNGHRTPSSQPVNPCPLFLCPGPWQARECSQRMHLALQHGLAKWA